MKLLGKFHSKNISNCVIMTWVYKKPPSEDRGQRNYVMPRKRKEKT